MKKASRQSHPGKSAAMKHDTSQVEIEGESTNTQLTGVFCEDFSIMCERAGLVKIPLVVHNTKLQSDVSIDDHSSLCSRLHVTLEDDEPNAIKHIHFRNMKINYTLACILDEASAKCLAIHTLSLWNIGRPFFDTTTRAKLQDWMRGHSVQNLSIGSSNVPRDVFSDLIGSQASLMLQKLSLKCCQLNDSHCEQLCPVLEENKLLLCLNLGCNSITDAGLFYISKALKRNRVLLSLSLMGNKISDEGAIGLAEVLSRFSLSHSEMVDRRKLLLDRKGTDEEHQLSVRSSPSTASLSDRSSRQAKGSTSDKVKPPSIKVKHENVAKKEEKLKKDDKSKKAISSPDSSKKAQKAGRDSKVATAKKPMQLESHPPSPKVESVEPVAGDPLLEEGEEAAEGTIVLPGNMILASLSVGNNLITEQGLNAFLDAIDIQKQYSHRGQGLLRLEFKHNLFSSSSSVAKQLEEAMLVRDPYYEPPSSESQDDSATTETTNSLITPSTT